MKLGFCSLAVLLAFVPSLQLQAAAPSERVAVQAPSRLALADTDEDCDDAMEKGGGLQVESWSWGETQVGAGSSQARGKEKSGHVTLIKRSDAASAQLAQRKAGGKACTMVLRTPAGERVVFHNAVISSITSKDGFETIVISCTKATGQAVQGAEPAEALKAKEKANRGKAAN